MSNKYFLMEIKKYNDEILDHFIKIYTNKLKLFELFKFLSLYENYNKIIKNKVDELKNKNMFIRKYTKYNFKLWT